VTGYPGKREVFEESADGRHAVTKSSLYPVVLALVSVGGAVGCSEHTALTAHLACDPLDDRCPTGQSCQFMCGGDLTGMYCAEDKSGNIPYGESCGPVPGDDCQRGAECMLRWYSDAGVPAYGTCQAYCQTDAQCLAGEHCKAITCLTDPSKPAHECVKTRPEDGSGG